MKRKRTVPNPCSFPGCENMCITVKARYCPECQQMFLVAKHKTINHQKSYLNGKITVEKLTEKLAAVRSKARAALEQNAFSQQKLRKVAALPPGQTISSFVPGDARLCFHCPMLGPGCRERLIPPCKPAGGMYRQFTAVYNRREVYG